jgi:putative drug exporter of the RND superfamily
MFGRLGDTIVRRRRWVVILTILFAIAAGAIGGGVAGDLSSGGFDDPNAESAQAAETLKREFGHEDPNLVLLVSSDGSVDERNVAAEGIALTEELAAERNVTQVASYWTTRSPEMRSTDGDQALVLGVIEGNEDEVRDRIEELSSKYTRDGSSIDVSVGGFAEIFRQVSDRVEEDLARAESIAFPITLILLVLVFGSLVAGFLPLIVGGIAIIGTFLILQIMTGFTEVSIYSLNLTTMLGLGLAIDYSLFVVSRFREELKNGLDVADAVRTTVKTAGRTVAFSGLTVALSLAALVVFPLAFLRSFAYAGVGVVLMAALGAIVFLPALLMMLGHRVNKLSIRRRSRPEAGNGFWHRMASFVMRRPVPIATSVIIVLLVLGAPFLNVRWGQADDRSLPEGTSSRVVSQQIRDNFTSNSSNALSVVATNTGDPRAESATIERFALRLSDVDGVEVVDGLTGTYSDGTKVAEPTPASERYGNGDAAWFSVIPAVEAYSSEGERLVQDIRRLNSPYEIEITGPSATLVDQKDSLFSRVPLAALLIGLATFILLFLSFGSIVVPVKAIVLNLLSLTATFGAVVWIFQDGNLSGFLDFTPTGMIETTSPILMFCVAFGLSMDYEVFLLSRIKEEYDKTGDNTASVAMGLEHTGRIVTAAAVLLSVVFVAFATSGVTFIKLFGLGLTIAVLMDATLVRATLVPAFMRLAGRANWWAPAWMRKVYDRFGISEAPPLPKVGPPAPSKGGVT